MTTNETSFEGKEQKCDKINCLKLQASVQSVVDSKEMLDR